MRTVALAGDMGSGKSSVAERLRTTHGFAVRSFGDVVRAEAQSRGLGVGDRTVLQNLGQELIRTIGPNGMVERILDPSAPSLVLDGIRHFDVLAELAARLPDLVFVFLSASDSSLDKRWQARGDQVSRRTAIGHPIEAEVAALRAEASLVIYTEDFRLNQVAEVIAAAAQSACA